jgi:N-acetylglucosaminyl-diphospho-decaprenol L-rhamnosyltransferase
MKNIAIIIVNYNVTDEVIKLLESIQLYLSRILIEVIVIDNNSPDRSIVKQSSKFPNVKFVFLNENIGYSKANNLGVKYSNSDYLLFLNPDTEIIEDCISPMIEFIETNIIAGACGPMLLNDDFSYQNSTGNTLGILYEVMEALMLINIYRKIYKFFKNSLFKSCEPFEIGWLSGACLLAKRKVIVQLGGFNTEYFLNYEDIDLCKRIQDIGYKNYYFPHLRCIHLNQKSQKQDYESLTYNRYLSRLTYAKNNYGSVKRFLVRYIHIIGLLLRLIFVNFISFKIERQQRKIGYLKSLSLYYKFVNSH